MGVIITPVIIHGFYTYLLILQIILFMQLVNVNILKLINLIINLLKLIGRNHLLINMIESTS